MPQFQCPMCQLTLSNKGNLTRHINQSCCKREQTRGTRMKCMFCGSPTDGSFFKDVQQTADHVLTLRCWNARNALTAEDRAKLLEPTLENFVLVRDTYPGCKKAFSAEGRTRKFFNFNRHHLSWLNEKSKSEKPVRHRLHHRGGR